MLTVPSPSPSGRSSYDLEEQARRARNRLMEPPLGIAGLPARTRPTTPRPSLTNAPRESQTRPARPLFATVESPRSIAILNRQPSRENLNPSECAKILLRDCPMSRSVVTPCFRACRRRVRFGPSQLSRQNASLTFGVCHSHCFCQPCPSPARAAPSFRVRVWACFRHAWGERNTLTNP